MELSIRLRYHFAENRLQHAVFDKFQSLGGFSDSAFKKRLRDAEVWLDQAISSLKTDANSVGRIPLGISKAAIHLFFSEPDEAADLLRKMRDIVKKRCFATQLEGGELVDDTDSAIVFLDILDAAIEFERTKAIADESWFKACEAYREVAQRHFYSVWTGSMLAPITLIERSLQATAEKRGLYRPVMKAVHWRNCLDLAHFQFYTEKIWKLITKGLEGVSLSCSEYPPLEDLDTRVFLPIGSP